MYRIDPSIYECADSALLELIEKAKVSALTDDELVRYEAGLKALEDAVDFDELLSDSVREAKAESFAEGKTQAQIEIAKRMLSMKMDVEMIAHILGLSVEEIKKLG
jgi:predicted transposase/invertase (TIGR01784 family)